MDYHYWSSILLPSNYVFGWFPMVFRVVCDFHLFLYLIGFFLIIFFYVFVSLFIQMSVLSESIRVIVLFEFLPCHVSLLYVFFCFRWDELFCSFHLNFFQVPIHPGGRWLYQLVMMLHGWPHQMSLLHGILGQQLFIVNVFVASCSDISGDSYLLFGKSCRCDHIMVTEVFFNGCGVCE